MKWMLTLNLIIKFHIKMVQGVKFYLMMQLNFITKKKQKFGVPLIDNILKTQGKTFR